MRVLRSRTKGVGTVDTPSKVIDALLAAIHRSESVHARSSRTLRDDLGIFEEVGAPLRVF